MLMRDRERERTLVIPWDGVVQTEQGWWSDLNCSRYSDDVEIVFFSRADKTVNLSIEQHIHTDNVHHTQAQVDDAKDKKQAKKKKYLLII